MRAGTCGVIGVALAYDDLFVREVGRHLAHERGDLTHTIEFSTMAAAVLAAVAGLGDSASAPLAEPACPPNFVPRFSCTAAAPYSTGLDVALVRLPDRGMTRPVVASTKTAQLWQGLPLRFVGGRSGLQRVQISSYSIWHEYVLPGPGATACVHDCLQIKLQDRPYVRADVSAGGDFGAWLIADSADGPVWVGVLVGGDGDRSGIVPAERVLDHFETLLGPLTAGL